jgi:hypothetical protein
LGRLIASGYDLKDLATFKNINTEKDVIDALR